MCVRSLARCRTSAGCSGPTAESSQAAWAEEHRKEPEGLLVEAHPGRRTAAVGSPAGGILDLGADPAAGSLDPGVGTAAVGAGHHVHYVRNNHLGGRDLQDQHRRVRHESLKSCLRVLL